MYLAGLPATILFDGMSCVTTEPAPIITLFLMRVLHKITLLALIKTLLPMLTIPIFVCAPTFTVLASCARIFTLLEMVTSLPIEMSQCQLPSIAYGE